MSAVPLVTSSITHLAPAAPAKALPTVWGLDPVQLHARYWASLGVQVVRPGEPSEIVRHAELYLLLELGCLALFPLGPLMEALNWVRPRAVFVRVHDERASGYREEVVSDAEDRFVCVRRVYGNGGRPTRVAVTPDHDVARTWQSSGSGGRDGWRRLRRAMGRRDRAHASVDGAVYDQGFPADVAAFVPALVKRWREPATSIQRARRFQDGAWRDPRARIEAGATLAGPVWVGAGRVIRSGETVVGPAVAWDDPAARPPPEEIRWLTIEPAQAPPPPPPPPFLRARDVGLGGRAAKRLFDIAFASVALLATLPLYPFILLAIWLEDGRPFFFAHRRQSRGGREFPCLKFRSMRKDAEAIKETLGAANQADGPQFFIRDDPRLTRTGRFLRDTNLDELPQFFNVLAGHMSVVGPRPSPHRENQFCPAWREARLSVRPGITGLWQVSRTRRAGSDFQEWIRYDLEYVRRRTFLLDLWIIVQTVRELARKAKA